MTQYETELQHLKDWDEVQGSEQWHGYTFITTAGHGYLVVPKADKFAAKARAICKYGFTGRLAYYLEEDCEAGEFLRAAGAAQ